MLDVGLLHFWKSLNLPNYMDYRLRGWPDHSKTSGQCCFHFASTPTMVSVRKKKCRWFMRKSLDHSFWVSCSTYYWTASSVNSGNLPVCPFRPWGLAHWTGGVQSSHSGTVIHRWASLSITTKYTLGPYISSQPRQLCWVKMHYITIIYVSEVPPGVYKHIHTRWCTFSPSGSNLQSGMSCTGVAFRLTQTGTSIKYNYTRFAVPGR